MEQKKIVRLTQNWIKHERQSEHKRAQKVLDKVKARDKGKKLKRVPIDSPRAFKLVEIK